MVNYFFFFADRGAQSKTTGLNCPPKISKEGRS